MKKAPIILLFFCSILSAQSQERLQPGKIYDSGEELFAPRVGLRSVVPPGWFGTLPQEEEVFLMIPNTNQTGYMFINAHKATLEELKDHWKKDFSLTDAITVSIKDETEMKDGRLCTEFEVIGSVEPAIAYAEAIDGGYGYTISFVLLSPLTEYDAFMKDFRALVNSSTVNQPSLGSIYDEFDWPEFLFNKYFMSYIRADHYREQNEIWLCGDGTFKSKIKSGGLVKGEKSPYKGTNKGTWKAEGKGAKGKLHLDFNKKTPLVIDVEIKNDKIYVNGERYFALENTNCK